MKRILGDNGLLFDRPWSYWTIGSQFILGIYLILWASGQGPLWLQLIVLANTFAWIVVFMKGGAWDWFKHFIPDMTPKP